MPARTRHRLSVVLTALGGLALVGCSNTAAPATSASSTTAQPAGSTTASISSRPAAASTSASTARTRTTPAAPRTVVPTPTRRSSATSTTVPSRPGLPLDLSTGNATQVITVVASSSSATRASLQRWRKSGGRWVKVGRAASAYLGVDGTGSASESTSKTPAGSYTLTQAFGRDANPGTRLPFQRTTPDDYWISSPGPNYNTFQRCGSCGYDNGTNERLYDVTPEYGYAVVIDYNTRNAPGGVRPGRGSAFFLHLSAGKPTSGCVAIPRGDLVDAMTWLDPSSHPRILIGVGSG